MEHVQREIASRQHLFDTPAVAQQQARLEAQVSEARRAVRHGGAGRQAQRVLAWAWAWACTPPTTGRVGQCLLPMPHATICAPTARLHAPVT